MVGKSDYSKGATGPDGFIILSVHNDINGKTATVPKRVIKKKTRERDITEIYTIHIRQYLPRTSERLRLCSVVTELICHLIAIYKRRGRTRNVNDKRRTKVKVRGRRERPQSDAQQNKQRSNALGILICRRSETFTTRYEH